MRDSMGFLRPFYRLAAYGPLISGLTSVEELLEEQAMASD